MNRYNRPGFAGRTGRGFTLIELMISVAVIGILVAVSLPSYKQYVLRGKRSAAQATMMDIASREEQFLLANRSYADKPTLVANGYALPPEVAANYSYDVTTAVDPAPSYQIRFTAINTQVSDGDLTLSSDGTRSPAAKW